MAAPAPTQDVLASAVKELAPRWINNFSRSHPLLQHMLGGSNMSEAAGPYVEFSPVIGGPGRAEFISTGSESWSGYKTPATKNGAVAYALIVYHWEPPKKEIDEANSDPSKAGSIIERWGEAAIEDVLNKIEQQLLMGGILDSSGAVVADGDNGFRGLGTLNGDKTGLPTAGLEAGLLNFVAPASQTGTVLNIVKRGGTSGVYEWYNQFPTDGAITNWDDHGYQRVKNAYNLASERAPSSKYIMVSDLGSFQKYEDSLQGQIRYVTMDGVAGDGEKGANQVSGLAFGQNGIWYPDQLLDDTTTFFDSARRSKGILYGVPTKHLHTKFMPGVLQKNPNGKGKTLGLKVEGPTPIWNADQVSYQVRLHMTWFVDRMNACFTACGMRA